jgi:GT2 family glycosyltransferase
VKRQTVAVVIPCHNERDSVLRCLTSIRASSVDLDIVVVDDGSTDGVEKSIADAFPSVRVLRGDGGMWWSGAINAGLDYALPNAATNAFILLNNDCVLEPDTIDRLVAKSLASPTSIVSATILDLADGSIVSFGGAITRAGLDYITDPPATDATGLCTVDWLAGHCILIPRSVVDSIGIIDAKAFPHYWADADYSLRARKAGFRLAVDPDIRVANDRGQTGVRIAGEPTFRGVYSLLTSRRSWLRVDENARFWFRHRDVLPARTMAARYSSTAVVAGRLVAEKLHIRPAIRWVVHRVRRPS